MKNILSIVFVILFCKAFSIEQQTLFDSLNVTQNKRFINVAGNIGSASYRDMGTSPLLYSGFITGAGLDYVKNSENRILIYRFNLNQAFYLANNVESAYFATGTIFNGEFMWFQKVHSKFYNEKLLMNNFVGLSVSNFSNINMNDNLMNAAVTFSNFTNFEIKYRYEMSWRKKFRQMDLIFFKLTFPEKRYLFSFDLGFPFYSQIFRPGFSQIGNGTESTDIILFPGYESFPNYFSGAKTDIAIARVLNNGNMIKYSYRWSYIASGNNDYNPLQMAEHLFMLSLVFNLD